MVAKKPKIVIVGAGMAGLTAAHKLHLAGATSPGRELFDLCVVEAGDRVGGRIYSSKFAGVRVEMGATWIHGIGGSPIYDIASKVGALQSALPWERMDGFPEGPVTLAEGGELVDASMVADITSLYRGLMDLARSGSVPIAPPPSESSVGAFLRRGLQTYPASRARDPPASASARRGSWTLEALEEAVFAINENVERTDTSADDLAGLDLAAEGEYRAFPGEQITIAQGYSRVIEHLASALPPGLIRLGKKVERIEWRPHGCPSPPHGDDPPVRLHFEEGATMAADHVVVTVSLGVLKAAVRKDASATGLFSPGLPPFKREAIGRLGFGVVNKLFMEHDAGGAEGPGFPFLQLAFDREPPSPRRVATIPRWIRRTPSICPVYSGSRVLLAWFVGKEATELESLGDDEIIRGIHATLDGFSAGGPCGAKKDASWRCNGSAAGEVSDAGRPAGTVTRVTKSSWGTDPLFLGSYSYVAVGSSGEDLDLMAEPLPRCHGGSGPRPLQILFAGEATHRTHYSTTHGAYLSGIREARRLLQHYNYSCS
uniref:Putative polyamine oxidase 5 n=1 Tax=Anthurium amnicola TaxID=1678845 RepID=A0A1D1Z0M1_9ARAE